MSTKLLIAIEPSDKGFRAFLDFADFMGLSEDPERLLSRGEKIYVSHLARMTAILETVDQRKIRKEPVPGKLAWELGDMIFRLKSKLDESSLEVNGLYQHLSRDLNRSVPWLKKVVSLRRNVPSVKDLPKNITMGKCITSPKFVGEKAALLKKRRKGFDR